jgi:hypothetical protein
MRQYLRCFRRGSLRVLRQVIDHLPIGPECLLVHVLKEQYQVSAGPLLVYLKQWKEEGLADLK